VVHAVVLTLAVVAPLSELYGRLPLYHSCSLLFIIFTVLAAVSTNMSMFIAFRFLMGCKFYSNSALNYFEFF
jgi:MFS family permease